MKNVFLVVLACIIGSAFGATCTAQEMPKLNLKESPSSEVVFVPFIESQFPAFGDVFKNETAGLQRASFVVSNQSDRAIIGIAVRWTVVARDGSTLRMKWHTHMYLSTTPAPIAPPHGRLLVAPAMFVPESVVTSGGGMVGFTPVPQLVSKFNAASQIYADVDCIIFGDGEVVGLDRSQLAAQIQDRKTAADMIVNRVRAAQANGENLSDVISRLATSEISTRDFVGREAAGLAQQLLGTQHPDAFLSYLEGIPAPVNLYRKDGGALR
jgi:hypothetical protein